MKLATTTGDFQAYTKNQDYAISEIKRAGFKYVDYSFIMDYKNNNGIFGKNFDEHILMNIILCWQLLTLYEDHR